MLFAQITAESIQDAATMNLGINPLCIAACAVLIYVFRERIGNFFAEFGRSKKAVAAKVAVSSPEEAVAEPAKRTRIIPTPELVFRTLRQAGIDATVSETFVKEHFGTIMANYEKTKTQG